MISKETAICIIATINSWQRKYEVPKEAVQELLDRLSLVNGNESFMKSIKTLAERYPRVVFPG